MKQFDPTNFDYSPILPGSLPLWKKFIDPADWEPAQAICTAEPWTYYMLPGPMQYPNEAWLNFQKGCRLIIEKAGTPPDGKVDVITIQDLFEINALILTGDAINWTAALRSNRPIFNCHKPADLLRVFSKGTKYNNTDGLEISVDGFRPANQTSIDFFVACRLLGKVDSETSPEQMLQIHRQFLSQLDTQVNASHNLWQIYFLTVADDISRQLQVILNWYRDSTKSIFELPKNSPATKRKIVELAVKMQRFIDITQFCADGSGRTSKLIQDYIFLRFGIKPPAPVVYNAHQRSWSNGTYLTLEEALEMTEAGFADIAP